MNNLINPVERQKLKKELSLDKLLRYTNYGNREVYVITAHDSPETMLEVGRLRELTFRQAGGGTGKEVDIDEFDTMEKPYKQLVVWDSTQQEIVGGYRFIEGKDVVLNPDGSPHLSTTEIFSFKPSFVKDNLPSIIELGRSFIQPNYQTARSGIFSLDNLWDGLGGLVFAHPEIDAFFGKVTMYTSYNKEARDTILYFVQKYHPDPNKFVVPMEPIQLESDIEKLEALYKGYSLEEAYKIMLRRVRELGENVPPLFNSYLKLSPSMISFGTAINSHFGEVEETGILIRINEIYPTKKERHIPRSLEEMKTKKNKDAN